jgi:hypothetical protein
VASDASAKSTSFSLVEVIGRGHLASIHIRETWPSADPELARQQSAMLAMIGTLAPEEAAAKWMESMHPNLKEHIRQEDLTTFIAAAAEQLGEPATAINLDRWQASSGAYSTAMGPVEFTKAATRVQSNWMDGHWLGVSLLTENFAASTHDLLPQYTDVQELAVRFWESLFEGNFAAAHACLAEDFQRRLGVEQLQELFESAEFGTLTRLQRVTYDRLRIADRDSRPLPVMLTAYCIAEFEDGSYIPISCEFTRGGAVEAVPQLLNFSTDVIGTFPLADATEGQLFWKAFSGADSAAIRRLVSQETRDRIQPEVLSGFLSELQQVLGSDGEESSSSTSSFAGRALRVYDAGRQLVQLNRRVVGPQGQVDMLATFERGELRNFQFTHPALETFAQRVENKALLDAPAREFLQLWLSSDSLRVENTERLKPFLASELKDEAGMGRLIGLHRQLLLESGGMLDAEIVARTPSADSNRIELEWRLQLERGERRVKLTYKVNALAGLIEDVQVIADDQ